MTMIDPPCKEARQLRLAGESGWYAAQLKPNGEALALSNLERQGFNTFRPQVWETLRTDKAVKRVMRSMFPGYLFVEFDIADPTWHSIRSTRGITRLVGNPSGRPSRLPNDLIRELMARSASNLAADPAKNIQPGDKVHLANGPFATLLATVEKLDARQRVWLLIDLMGRQTRLSATLDQIS